MPMRSQLAVTYAIRSQLTVLSTGPVSLYSAYAHTLLPLVGTSWHPVSWSTAAKDGTSNTLSELL